MKTKHFVILAIVMPFILAVLLSAIVSGQKTAPIPAGLDIAQQPPIAEPEEREEAAAPPPAAPGVDDVVRVTLAMAGDEDPAIDLVKRDGSWLLESHNARPADAGKIDRLLRNLLEAERVDSGAAPDENTGTGEGEGVVVVPYADGGDGAAFVVGLSPEGRLGETYVRRAGSDADYVLLADIRGDMGLWRNHPGEKPDPGFWMDTHILRFDPAEASGLEAVYPDHRLAFSRGDDAGWTMAGAAPGGEFDQNGFAGWLRDLSLFRALPGDPGKGDVSRFDSPDFSVAVTLADGEVKTVSAVFDKADGAFYVVGSDRPGMVYALPEWRFTLYFEPLAALFPKAAPSYLVSEIRYIDCRKGGESVKLMPREGEWRATGLPYPVRADKADALARRLASWKPYSHADSRTRASRSIYGGPLVEVTLANDTVVQYRLGDAHPVLPRRYVVVDGSTVLTAKADEAEAMFPDPAQLFDLGKALRDADADAIDSIRLIEPGERRQLAFRRENGGDWQIEAEPGDSAGQAPGSTDFLTDPLFWNIEGFPAESDALFSRPESVYTLILAGGGKTHRLMFPPPAESTTPALIDDDRAVLLNGGAVREWLEKTAALVPVAIDGEKREDEAPASDRREPAESAAAADAALIGDSEEPSRKDESVETAEDEALADEEREEEEIFVSDEEPDLLSAPETRLEEAAALVRSEVESIARAEEEEAERKAEEIRAETGVSVVLDESPEEAAARVKAEADAISEAEQKEAEDRADAIRHDAGASVVLDESVADAAVRVAAEVEALDKAEKDEAEQKAVELRERLENAEPGETPEDVRTSATK